MSKIKAARDVDQMSKLDHRLRSWIDIEPAFLLQGSRCVMAYLIWRSGNVHKDKIPNLGISRKLLI